MKHRKPLERCTSVCIMTAMLGSPGGLVPADASKFEEARALVGGAVEDDAEVCATLFR